MQGLMTSTHSLKGLTVRFLLIWFPYSGTSEHARESRGLLPQNLLAVQIKYIFAYTCCCILNAFLWHPPLPAGTHLMLCFRPVEIQKSAACL